MGSDRVWVLGLLRSKSKQVRYSYLGNSTSEEIPCMWSGGRLSARKLCGQGAHISYFFLWRALVWHLFVGRFQTCRKFSAQESDARRPFITYSVERRRGAAAGVTVTVAVTWPNGRPARQAPPSAKRRQSLSAARIEAPRRGCGDAPNKAADC